jgi:hypothetical protein
VCVGAGAGAFATERARSCSERAERKPKNNAKLRTPSSAKSTLRSGRPSAAKKREERGLFTVDPLPRKGSSFIEFFPRELALREALGALRESQD